MPSPWSVTITGGDAVTRSGSETGVPKRHLVSVVRVLLQSGRLRVAAALPEADTLVRELSACRAKMTAAAHDTYGGWREGAHDDLVLVAALTCRHGENGRRCWLLVG